MNVESFWIVFSNSNHHAPSIVKGKLEAVALNTIFSSLQRFDCLTLLKRMIFKVSPVYLFIYF